ncbi:MAG: DUF433 domain-containing protein [Dehalococcoidia bacterium]|nr:DUF433 domain-containing protein [Dehalococcoidia bacterium]
MTSVSTIDDRFRTGKAYTIRQAAYLAEVSPGTVRNWLWGSTTAYGYEMAPVFGRKDKPEEVAQVSFLELSELIVAARWRKGRIKLHRIRDAHDFARTEWNLQYPFAHLNLTTIGGHILRRFEEKYPSAGPSFVVLSSPSQYVLPDFVLDELAQFVYNEADQFAERWYRYGREIPVVVDPHYAGGKPTIAGRGVSVEILHKRWKAGESFKSIARDFRLKQGDVEAVLQKVA